MSTITKDLGAVTAYAYAVEQGYTGTEEEFAELMADYASVGQSAAQSAEQAAASATSASQSAQTATTKASEASASASTASTKASEASASATTASTKASEASASATSAQTAQGLAEVARDDAIGAKTDAETARDLAQQYAESIDPDNIYSAYPTDTASGAVATFEDGADDIPMKSVKVAIEPAQDLHGQEAPYPAGGGKNLFDEENATIYNRFFKEQGNTFVWMQAPDSASVVFPCTEGTTYTVSAYNSKLTIFRVGTIEELPSTSTDAPVISDATRMTQSGSITITPGSGATYIVIQCSATIINNQACKLQIELGSTATDYAPYSNICPISGWTWCNISHSGADTSDVTVYPITFPSEAGTVYGGMLDVTTGELVVDVANIASYNGETLPSTWISDRDAYSVGTTPTTGAQVVYELAEPIHYTLTPTEIRSLLGTNNVWADTGDSTVEYRADTKLYINKKIAEAVNALT